MSLLSDPAIIRVKNDTKTTTKHFNQVLEPITGLSAVDANTNKIILNWADVS